MHYGSRSNAEMLVHSGFYFDAHLGDYTTIMLGAAQSAAYTCSQRQRWIPPTQRRACRPRCCSCSPSLCLARAILEVTHVAALVGLHSTPAAKSTRRQLPLRGFQALPKVRLCFIVSHADCISGARQAAD